MSLRNNLTFWKHIFDVSLKIILGWMTSLSFKLIACQSHSETQIWGIYCKLPYFPEYVSLY